MLNLLVKDLKLLFLSDKSSIKKKIMSLIFTALMMIIFVVFEVYLFVMIINKVKIYSNAATAFLTLFLVVISVIMMFLNIGRAHKLFFNEKDIEQLTHYPVTNDQIILSKLVFMLIMHYITSLIFVYPIFIAYGQIIGRTPIFYFLCIFYPLLSFLFEGGVALILVYPFKLLIDYLKKHLILQFITAVVIMVGLCFLYSKVLTVFMDLVMSNNLSSLFTTKSIISLRNAMDKMIPINFLAEMFLGVDGQFIPYFCITIGIFAIGLAISIFAFNYFRSIRFNSKPKPLKGNLKVQSVKKILIKKELILLFKNSNNIFSFTGLLVVQPFLLYLVISALNGVFSSGLFQFYMLVLPQFVPLLDIVIIMLFTLIINSGANSYITVEKNTMKIMKTIPVNYKTQLFIKAAVPFVASTISLIVSTLVLYVLGTVSFRTFMFGTLLSIVLLLVFVLVSFKEELGIRMNKPRSSFMSSLYSYLLPILFFVVALVTSYFGVSILLSYFIGLLVIIMLGIPYIVILKKKTSSLFMDLEVVN